MLTTEQRALLRSRAHHMDPVVIVGDAGLTEAVLREIDLALRSHELIKVRVLGDDRAVRQGVASAVCEQHGADLVQQIGKLVVLYRVSPADAKPAVRRRKPTGPRRTKKQEAARAERVRRR